MTEYKQVFLKVDGVDPEYKCTYGICDNRPYLDGIKVWIGGEGHFFECDRYTICDPDIVREEGRRQVVELMKELGKMAQADKKKLFGYCVVYDIITRLSYEEITEKLDIWKKEKEKIRVRDEVVHQSMQEKFVVTKIITTTGGEDAIVNGLKKDGTAVKGLLLCNLKKTGLHVDDLDEYLEV